KTVTKNGEYPSDPIYCRARVLAPTGLQRQILKHRELSEDAATFGDEAKAAPSDSMSCQTIDPGSANTDRPGGRLHQTSGHSEKGRLAGAIRTNKRNHRALRHVEG